MRRITPLAKCALRGLLLYVGSIPKNSRVGSLATVADFELTPSSMRDAGLHPRALEEQLAKYPLRFAKSAIIGPGPGRPGDIYNGTATLVNLKRGPTAITCQHVVAAALSGGSGSGKRVFQIGDAVVDLESQLISQNVELDIATIRIESAQLPQILAGKEIGTAFFLPAVWPPIMPARGDFVSFGGFPGILRSALSNRDLEFGSWSSGATQVDSVSPRQFISRFERDYWIQSFGGQEAFALNNLGGLSGGPVFIWRGLRCDLVGIVKEYHEEYDAMFFASLEWVTDEGEIVAPHL